MTTQNKFNQNDGSINQPSYLVIKKTRAKYSTNSEVAVKLLNNYYYLFVFKFRIYSCV